jgi:hypothetical protein
VTGEILLLKSHRSMVKALQLFRFWLFGRYFAEKLLERSFGIDPVIVLFVKISNSNEYSFIFGKHKQTRGNIEKKNMTI